MATCCEREREVGASPLTLLCTTTARSLQVHFRLQVSRTVHGCTRARGRPHRVRAIAAHRRAAAGVRPRARFERSKRAGMYVGTVRNQPRATRPRRLGRPAETGDEAVVVPRG